MITHIGIHGIAHPAWFGLGAALEFCQEKNITLEQFNASLAQGDILLLFEIVDKAITYGYQLKEIPRPSSLTPLTIKFEIGWDAKKLSAMIEPLFDVPTEDVSDPNGLALKDTPYPKPSAIMQPITSALLDTPLTNFTNYDSATTSGSPELYNNDTLRKLTDPADIGI
jgi:hypothetical protein